MKRLNASAKSRLPLILVVIAVLILSFGISIIVSLCRLTKHVEMEADRSSERLRCEVKSEVEKTTKLLNQIMSGSTMNTARALSSSLNGSKPSLFSDIENNVAPSLFEALSKTPYLNQISYIGFEGIFFSYFIDDQNQTFAMYSNASLGHEHTSPISAYWYTQMADRITGKLTGDIIPSFQTKFLGNSSWLQQALELKTDSHSVLGTNWNDDREALLINTARVHENLGLVSLGFSIEEITRYYTGTDDVRDGKSCIVVAGDGKFLAGDSMFSIVPAKENRERNFSCDPSGTLSNSAKESLIMEERNHIFGCSHLDLLGVQLVYALAIHKSGFTHFVDRYKTTILVLLVFTVVITIALISVLLPIIRRDSIRNMYLSATLMKQMNATEQAERKSMNKTRAFATASHDIRASLAGMIGLIQICYDQVPSDSELKTTLRQLEGCTNDLSGMLTSILDTSKIEAGKMSLEEEEFDVGQLFEDVVDLYHPVGAKKGVDVIWDPCDGSISKFCRVKCDRVKLRQILSNLLSNAVKFTSEGHVVVRAWIRKPTLENSILNEKPDRCSNGLMRSLTCLWFKDKTENDQNLEAMEITERDSDSMQLVCEIDDTGKGIPKEKRNEVFENYVQVKETALGQGGTGLGLGIVQSLVRLMHGEIGIMDKDIGEKGSCFTFNIALSVPDNQEDSVSSPSPSPQITPLVPTQSPNNNKLESSIVVLLIENEERRRVLKKFMESLGVRAFSLRWPHQLPRALKKIECKRNRSSSSNVSDVIVEVELLSKSSLSQNSSLDGGADYLRTLFRKTSHHFRSTTLGLVLLVVDANLGKLPELHKAVEEFRNGLIQSACRVVWLANSQMTQSNIRGKIFDPNDIFHYKPLHGSRLYEMARLLPEFGGSVPEKLFEGGSGNISHVNVSKSRGNNKRNQSETRPEIGSPSDTKPLFGRKILVVDDNVVMRKIAMYIFERLGGKVELCTNGKEAVELISNGLEYQKKLGDSKITLPFDYILMDCEMPIMDGYDATSEIRGLEMSYCVHIPIIGLTAHSPDSEEAKRTFKAGMDACLSKPLTDANLLNVIRKMDGKNKQ